VLDPDDDYLGIEIRAASGRFAGTAYIYAGLDELSSFASAIAEFPRTPADERRHEFGSSDAKVAGGYVRICLRCVDGAGHALLEIVVEGDDRLYTPGSAAFSFPVWAADLDRFVERLRVIERARKGEAALPATD
jgi:hypothetical protein